MTDKRYNPLNTETHRQCAYCKQVLPRSAFGKNSRQAGNNTSYCLECFRKRHHTSYQKRKSFVLQRRKELKNECVQLLGGKCQRCGYSEFVSGLDFHHTDDKESEISELVTNASYGNGAKKDELLKEISKCILLCRNCHGSFHANEWN